VLDERIGRDLPQIYNRLDREGRLLSQAQLLGYYETFRQRFGPDKLANLDGEVLLKKIHGPGKDSLVYWLEFKNDEEFPAKFGSISGGSALKFGIYYFSETRLLLEVQMDPRENCFAYLHRRSNIQKRTARKSEGGQTNDPNHLAGGLEGQDRSER
jgi:hypothetical protein